MRFRYITAKREGLHRVFGVRLIDPDDTPRTPLDCQAPTEEPMVDEHGKPRFVLDETGLHDHPMTTEAWESKRDRNHEIKLRIGAKYRLTEEIAILRRAIAGGAGDEFAQYHRFVERTIEAVKGEMR